MQDGKTELRLIVDTAYLNELYELTGSTSELQVIGEALGLLRWSAGEAARGRPTMSGTPDGKALVRLDMPMLKTILERTAHEPVLAGHDALPAPGAAAVSESPDNPFSGRRGK